MGSSVSSERAFSAAGITISKRRSRLKGDIVEALECLKCLLHRDLIFREVLKTEKMEEELDLLNCHEGDPDFVEVVEEANQFSWDQLLLDEDEG